MRCPYCLYLCDSDFDLCPSCNAHLYPHPSNFSVPEGFGESAAMEVVFRSSDPLEAQLVAATLSDANIPCSLLTELVDGTRFTSLEHACATGHQTALAVPAMAATEARELIHQLAGGPWQVQVGTAESPPPPRRSPFARTMAVAVLLAIGVPILAAVVVLLAAFLRL